MFSAWGGPTIADLDRGYRPFLPLRAWLDAPVSPLWDEYLANLTEARTLRPRRVADLDEKSLRRAALHTGALEGLHPADQVVTVTIVSHDAWRQAVAIEAGEETVGHVDASLQAYDLTLDLATGATQLSEASVRALHTLATGFQQTYEARVLVGGQWMRQDVELPRGQYKVQPNHVQTADGTFHSSAPVSRVSDEVRRLIAEITLPSSRGLTRLFRRLSRITRSSPYIPSPTATAG